MHGFALALAARQPNAALADPRFIALGQAFDEVRECGLLYCIPDAFVVDLRRFDTEGDKPTIEASARKMLCGTCAICLLQARRVVPSRRCPSISIAPPVGSSKPITRSTVVLFPLPVLPTEPPCFP